MDNYHEINFENNMKTLSQAVKYCARDYTHDDIITVLRSNDDIQKQLCLIELNMINSEEEAYILVNNLTGHCGPVRETAAYKILFLISKDDFKNFFQKKEIIDSFIKAITDINPSVSRYTVEIIKYIKDSRYLYNEIIKEINNTLSLTDTKTKNRSYVQNKKNFSLYWNLEAIISIADNISPSAELFDILITTAESNDYTIREKTAKAASIFSLKNPLFKDILKKLENDTNIYVRNYIKH